MNHALWVKRIEHALKGAQEIPLWGNPPPFPKDLFLQKLTELIPNFNWKEMKTDWVAATHLTSGFGDKPVVLTLELAPLAGHIFWIVSREDIVALTALLLVENNGKKGFSDPRLQEGYYRFLLLEILSLCPLYPDLTARILASASLPQDTALCQNITWSIGTTTMRGRLVISSEFHRSFKTHFESRPLSLVSSSLAAETMLSLSLEAGGVKLTYDIWKKIKIGDLLLLDRCNYDPKEKKGAIQAVFNQIPIFRGRIKQGQLKILEDAFFYEEQNPMDKKNPEEEDFNLDEEEEKEEEAEETSEQEKNHLWSAKNGNEGLIEKRIVSHDISLSVVVEMGRLQMSVEKLLQLQPGNMIDLAYDPEEHVTLTVQGKQIAKGELVKIGESIGVKILSIGE